MRWASFLPTPGDCSTAAQFCRAMALARSCGDSVPSTASATLAPTPWMVCSVRNQARSTSLVKPYRRMASSRTCVSMARLTGSPACSARSVRAEACTS